MVTLTIEHNAHAPTQHNGGYRVLSAKKDGKRFMSDMAGENPVTFIEAAVGKAVNLYAQPDDYTIELPAEVTLTSALETHLTSKLQADPLVTSVTFA